MLTNYEIDDLFINKNTGKKIKSYAGCFMKDELNDMDPELNKFYVVNMDNKGGEGTHWTGIMNPSKNRSIIYFDPFGLEPPKDVVRFCSRATTKKGKRKIAKYTKADIQNFDSDLCGWYVTYVCFQVMVKNMNIDKLLRDKFYENHKTWANDKIMEIIDRDVITINSNGKTKVISSYAK